MINKDQNTKVKPREKIEPYAGTSEYSEILVEKSAVKIFRCRQSAGKISHLILRKIPRDFTFDTNLICEDKVRTLWRHNELNHKDSE